MNLFFLIQPSVNLLKNRQRRGVLLFLTIFFWNIYVKNLWVKLAASNLFNAKEKGYSEYNGVYTSHWVDNRQPSISLTISYSFNPAKSKYKGKTAGEDELRRL